MPTFASSNLPPPKSWDEFEDIMLDVAKFKWDRVDFQRNGRLGQAQEGVDVYGQDENDNYIGIQCKNTVQGITFKLIEEEVAKAEKFEPELTKLYIATTAPRDAPIQKQVRQLSETRKLSRKFSISILFWADIASDIASNETFVFKHYPQFSNKLTDAQLHDKDLYDQLLRLLTSGGIINFLDTNNMAGFPFAYDKFYPLRDFYFEWSKPEKEFLLPELETLRSSLWHKINRYYELVGTETFALDANVNFRSVPSMWEIDQPDRFQRVVEEFHNLAREIVNLHGEFVRTGKRLLILSG